MAESDAICTALQLINFMQDVGIDWQKGRIYLPAEDLRRFEVSEQAIAAGDVGPNWQALMLFQHQRCQSLLHFGQPLAKTLRGRISLELRLIIQGGQRILDKLQVTQFDVFQHRPTLSSVDWITMFWRAIRSS
jgi:phytoene/squalene synthetase